MKDYCEYFRDLAEGKMNWIRPDDAALRKEYQIEYLKHLIHQLPSNIFPTEDAFIKAVKKAKTIEVTKAIDGKIENRSRTKNIKNLIAVISGYRSFPKFRNADTVKALDDRITKGLPVDMPIVVKFPKGGMRVFAGNTRMDLAFMHGINPVVILLDLTPYMSVKEETLAKDWSDREPTKGHSACSILSQPTQELFLDLYKRYKGTLGSAPKDMNYEVDDSGAMLIWGLREWFVQEGFDKTRFIAKLKSVLMSCKDRKPWTYYTGNVYRGLLKRIGDSNLKLSPEIMKLSLQTGYMECAVGTMTYTSKYEMQSWSSEATVAWNFMRVGIATKNYRVGSGKGKTTALPMMLKTRLKKEDSFLNPDFTHLRIFNNENEVIRLSNTPLKVEVYIDLYEIFKEIRGQYIQAHGASELKDMTLEKGQAFIYKTLKSIGGDEFAKALLNRTTRNVLSPDLTSGIPGYK